MSEIEILYEDESLLVVNKPIGIPSQDDKTGDPSLISLVGKGMHLFNRLDRPVSGIVVFGKTPAVVKSLSNDIIVKKYLAITYPQSEKEGLLNQHITKDTRRNKALLSDEPRDGWKQCSLKWRLLKKFDRYDLLEVSPHTGRFHQIRAQLSAMGAPIKGDLKYGARRTNPHTGIDLHAYYLRIASRDMTIIAPVNRSDTLWKEVAGMIPHIDV